MNLYEITKEWEEAIEKFYSCFDQETGELLEGMDYESAQKLMDDLENKRDEKVENILKFRANLQANITAIDSEIERLAALRTPIKNKCERFEKTLDEILGRHGRDKKYSFLNWNIKWNKGTSAVVDREDLIPKDLIKEKVTTSVDKVKLKELLKEGKEIEGAHLEETFNFSIK